MASISNTSAHPQLEDPAPSTSASPESSMPTFPRYEPPTTKLAFQSDKRYHVFLSFRGPDVRKTLVDHLYQALSAAGLNVFLDSEKLDKAEIIGLSLEKAMESSAIRIPIFSQGYADSAWCLKEAAAMLRTPGLIIPLFYRVDPTHVRYPQNESSPYKESFLKHYGHPYQHPEEVDEWKNALQQIGSRAGWSMGQGIEARLVKTVVNDLIKTLDKVPLLVAKHPVGIHKVKDALIQELYLNSVDWVVKVGIWGIGGIGKTTAAKAVYNQVYGHFEAASFVANVRAIDANVRGLQNLQKRILKDLTGYGAKVDSVAEGISLFTDRLAGKRVLLVLDDVDAIVQLNALVGNWLAPGSRVIITSRDAHILNVAQVSFSHEMIGLDINESLQLFSWHAFLSESPSPSHEDLSRRIVKACKGHPLSLEVIGSFLYDKQDDIDCWTEALDNITCHRDIHSRLNISYRALSDVEKEIFLDIACFFIGEEKTLPIVFWKSLYKMVDTTVSNLSMKLLIKIDDEGIFDMHDHLRDMGRTIAAEEKRDTRLWEAAHFSTIFNIHFSHLRINGGNPQRFDMLCKPGLRYLHLQNLPIEGMTKNTLAMLPSSLIWLRLENCSFPIGRSRVVKRPRHPRLIGHIAELRIMQIKGCYNLDSRFLSSLFSLPNILLQHLDLERCINLNNLPDTIANLSQLQHLDLRWCENLISLPDTIGNLSQLQVLLLEGCGSLNSLPNTIGNLSRLQHLDLEGCGSLNILPDAIGNLSQLQHLELVGCESFNRLPDTIGNLSQLQNLDLGTCESLKSLPDTIGNMSLLQHLYLEWCRSLNSLPNTIGNLPQLQCLYLRQCESLNSLPDTIGNLSQLQHIDLGCCGGLISLPDTIGNLLQLQHMDLGWCGSLISLPDTIGNLWQLQYLYLGGCESLNNLPDTIGNLAQLEYLSLEGCESLINLPDTICNLSKLQQLDLEGCIKLKNLHLDLGGCRSLNNLSDIIRNPSQLQYLNLEGSINLKDLPDTIGNLSQLQHLYLGGCRSLIKLPDTIGTLSQLQHLDLEGCVNLENLPDAIGNLSQLQHVNLGWCGSLKNIPDTIGKLSQLQHLKLSGCQGLNNLPCSIANLSQLQHLNMFECLSLKILPDTIGNLLQLHHLDLERCVSINNLPHAIGNLLQLQHLDLRWCDKLNNLPDTIGNLSQLQHLYLGGCRSLKNLPDTIGNLAQLQHLDLEGCINLKKLPHTIGNLTKLQHLDLGWCGSLKNLPDTIGNLSQLQHLKLRGCESLNNLPDTIGDLSQVQYFF